MSERNGWDWFEAAGSATGRPAPADIEIAFARCFGGPDGTQALRHLRDLTFGRVLGPDATEAQLRHLEAQRALVAYIAAQIGRGRGQS
ncbi:MAG: hypothetical protein AB7G39_03605 [Alphaproteobacteria bacterium]